MSSHQSEKKLIEIDRDLDDKSLKDQAVEDRSKNINRVDGVELHQRSLDKQKREDNLEKQRSKELIQKGADHSGAKDLYDQKVVQEKQRDKEEKERTKQMREKHVTASPDQRRLHTRNLELQKQDDEEQKKRSEEMRTRGVDRASDAVSIHQKNILDANNREKEEKEKSRLLREKGIFATPDHRELHSKNLTKQKEDEELERKRSENMRTKGVKGTISANYLHLQKQRNLEEDQKKAKKKAKEERTKRKAQGKGSISGSFHKEQEKQRKKKQNETLGPEIKADEIKAKWQKMREQKEEDNFILIGYNSKNQIVMKGSGNGAPSWFMDDEDYKGTPLFIGMRVVGTTSDHRGRETKKVKMVLILWIPKGTAFLTRSKMAYHKRKVEKILKPYQMFFQFSDDQFGEDFEKAMDALEKKIVKKLDDYDFMEKTEWAYE